MHVSLLAHPSPPADVVFFKVPQHDVHVQVDRAARCGREPAALAPRLLEQQVVVAQLRRRADVYGNVSATTAGSSGCDCLVSAHGVRYHQRSK